MGQRFQLGQVAEVLDTSPETIKAWLHRGFIVGCSEDGEQLVEGGGGRGVRRTFSIHAVMQMAVANEIVSAGIRDTQAAFEAAMRFAHTGKGDWGYLGEIRSSPPPRRNPGMPFHYSLGRTVLMMGKNASRVALERDTPSVFFKGEAVSITVNVSLVFDQVCSRLMEITGDKSFHPSAILDAAYPEHIEVH
jgi:hypothetical protein